MVTKSHPSNLSALLGTFADILSRHSLFAPQMRDCFPFQIHLVCLEMLRVM